MSARLRKMVAFLSAACVFALARAYMLYKFMEKNGCDANVYYIADEYAGYSYGFAAAVIIWLAVSAVYCLRSFRKMRPVIPLGRVFSALGCLVMGSSLLLSALFYIISLFNDGKAYSAGLSSLEAAVVVLAVAAAAVFLFHGVRCCLGARWISGTIAAASVLPMALLSAVRVLADFVRSGSGPLASSGGYHILGLCAAMLWFIFEGKAYLGGGNAVAAFFFGSSAIVLLLIYAVPDLLLCCTGQLTLDRYAVFSIVDVTTAAYISARLLTARCRERQKALPGAQTE